MAAMVVSWDVVQGLEFGVQVFGAWIVELVNRDGEGERLNEREYEDHLFQSKVQDFHTQFSLFLSIL